MIKKDVADGGRRVVSLDVVRTIAIMMVVMQHACHFEPGSLGEFAWLLGSGSAVDMLFMLSGILLLPVTTGYGKFYRHRFMRVGIPFLLWSAVYIVLDSLLGGASGEDTLWAFKRILFIPSFPPGWFIYAITGVYLMMPFVSPWIKSADGRSFGWFLGIWLLSMCLPYVAERWDLTIGVNGIFGLFYNFMGVAIAGSWLFRHADTILKRYGKVVLPVLIIIGIGLPAALHGYAVGRGHSRELLYTDLSLATVAWSAVCVLVIIAMFRHTDEKSLTARVFRFLSVNSFGIYLVHYAIIVYIVDSYCPELKAGWSFAPAVYAMSLAVTVVLRKIPVLGKYLC